MYTALVVALVGCGHGFRTRAPLISSGHLPPTGSVPAASSASESALAEVGVSNHNRPLVVNRASVPLVLYLESGFLFNMQVVNPGEAARLHSSTWGPEWMPYSIVALVGGHEALPTSMDSLLHLTGMVAWVVSSAAALIEETEPKNIIRGAGLAGYNVSASAVNATASNAAVAKFVADAISERLADMRVEARPEAFMAKLPHIHPGERYFEVTGGPDVSSNDPAREQALQISPISKRKYEQYGIKTVKNCIGERSIHKMEKAAFEVKGCGDDRANGRWTHRDMHRGRPRYNKADDEGWVIEWSQRRRVWRMFHDDTWLHYGRDTVYQSSVNSHTVPDRGWEPVSGGFPVPRVNLMVSSEEDEAEASSEDHGTSTEED